MHGSNEERNSYVRRQILKTLLNELEAKELLDIVISSFVLDAGVGRASFYRNYESLEDVLKQESSQLVNRWRQEFDKLPNTSLQDLFQSLIDFYRANSRFYTLLCKAGQSGIILDDILEAVHMSDDLSNKDAYAKAVFAYGLYGLIVEWIRRGMAETGAELFPAERGSDTISYAAGSDQSQ